MQIQFSTNAADMNRTCRRVGTKLALQSKYSNEFITFKITARNVEITVDGTAEGLAAKVQHEGKVSIPCTILYGIIRTLPYFGQREIEVGFSEGKMHIDGVAFHSRVIVPSHSVSPERRQSFLKGKSSASQLA